MLPWAAALSKKWIEENFKNDPSARCLPGDALLAGSATWQLIQTPAQLVTIVEGPPFVRQVFLDGRGHPAVDNLTWMGHSIGHWEGDTLVVDSVGFHDRGTVGGGTGPIRARKNFTSSNATGGPISDISRSNSQSTIRAPMPRPVRFTTLGILLRRARKFWNTFAKITRIYNT
jgi:hypothetical protein